MIAFKGNLLATFLSSVVLLSQIQSPQLEAYILLWAALVFIFVSGVVNKRSVNKYSIVLTFIVLFFVVFLVRPSRIAYLTSYYDLIYFAPVLGVVCVSPLFANHDRIYLYHLILYGFLLIGILNFVHYWLAPVPPFFLSEPYAGTRWVGGFDGPNEFGQFGVLIAALSLGLHLSGAISKWTLFPVLAASVIFIFNSFSRGAYLSLCVTLLVFLALWAARNKSWKHFFWISILIVAFYQTLSIYVLSLVEKFSRIRQAATDRNSIFEETLRLFLERPFFGGGFGIFSEAEYVNNTTPHSDYAYFLVAGGGVGILVFMTFNIILLWVSFKKNLYPEFLFFVAMSVNGLTFNNLVRGRLSLIFWVVLLAFLGYVWSSNHRRSRKIVGDSTVLSCTG